MVNLFFFTVILLLSISWKKGKFKRAPYIALFIYMAIRYGYGDYFSYLDRFYKFKQGIDSSFEPGYELLMKAAPNFTFVIVVSSAVFTIAIYLLFEKMCDAKYRTVYFAVLIANPYILLMDISAIRQTMALSIFIIGVYFYQKQRNILYVIFAILLAAQFHISAYVLLPTLLIMQLSRYSKTRAIAVAAGCGVLLLGNQLFDKLINWGLSLLNIANYYYYAGNGFKNSLGATLTCIAVLLFLLWQARSMTKNELFWTRLAVVGMTLEVLQMKMQMLGRLVMYFNIFYPIAIAAALRHPITFQGSKINYKFSKEFNWIVGSCIIALYAWKMRLYLFDDGFWKYSTLFSVFPEIP